jgi:hypothetical protein
MEEEHHPSSLGHFVPVLGLTKHLTLTFIASISTVSLRGVS